MVVLKIVSISVPVFVNEVTGIALADRTHPVLNEACAKALFNMASQEGGKYCRPVARLGGLVAMEKLAAKLGTAAPSRPFGYSFLRR